MRIRFDRVHNDREPARLVGLENDDGTHCRDAVWTRDGDEWLVTPPPEQHDDQVVGDLTRERDWLMRDLKEIADGCGVGVPDREEAKRRIIELAKWKEAVLNQVKRIPEYETGEWGGDKEGWGFVFELIGWQTREVAKLREALGRYGIHEPDCLAIPRPDNLGEVGCTCGLSAALGDDDDDYIEFQPVQPIERVEVTMHKPDDMTADEFRVALQEAADEAEEG